MPSHFADSAVPQDFKPVVNANIECALPDLIAAIEHNRDGFRSA